MNSRGKSFVFALGVLMLTACGGASEKGNKKDINEDKSIVFPSELPNEDEALNGQSPEGLWLLSRKYRGPSGDNKYLEESIEVAKLSLNSKTGAYHLHGCFVGHSSIPLTLQGQELNFNTNVSGDGIAMSGSLKLINNRKMHGDIGRLGMAETQLIYGIKLSDNDSFLLAPELSVDVRVESEDKLETESDINISCIGLRANKRVKDGFVISEGQGLRILGDNLGVNVDKSLGSRKHNIKNSDTGIKSYGDSSNESWFFDNHCLVDNITCNAQSSLEILQTTYDKKEMILKSKMVLNGINDGRFLNVDTKLGFNP